MHEVVHRSQAAAVPVLAMALRQACSWDGLIEWLPIGVFACDRDGTVVQHNRKAAELWGRSPAAGDGGFRVFEACRSSDGSRLPPDESPVHHVLRTGEPVRDREVIIERPDGSRFTALIDADPLFDADGKIVGGVSCFRDITERKSTLVDISERREAETRQAMLIGELNHRVKNTLAIVQAIAAQTLQHAGSPDGFRASFQARVMALSHAHDLLTDSNWEGACLCDIVGDTMMPFQSRCSIAGEPTVRIGPQSAVILAVAFHELATNAAHYGALANDVGRIAIAWNTQGSAKDQVLRVSWTETGGPPVSVPTRTGFGLKLVEKALAKQFDNVCLDFPPQGLVYSFAIRRSGDVFG